MEWHFKDIPLLIHNIPRALHDLMHHEDKELVKQGIANIAIPKNVTSSATAISIEKTIDPMALRAAQNIGLLLHDYLQQLPSFEVSHSDGEKLLEHWRKIILEQPQRLAIAKRTHWHDENTKAFWHNKIVSHQKDIGITSENFPDAWYDWQRASGIGHDIGNINQLQAMQQKQWQELMIRSRLHKETVRLWHEP